MYTSDDCQSKFFRANSQVINNATSMCSLMAEHGWSSRTPNRKMEAMPTSGRQLFRRIGSLMPLDGQQPKLFKSISTEHKKQQSGKR